MDRSEKTIFWHIGFPKTATTSLQQFVFPSIREINYLGWNYSEDPAEKMRRNGFVSQLRNITIWHSRGLQLEQSYTVDGLLREHYSPPLQSSKNFLVSDESVISRALVPQKKKRLLKFVSPLESIERLISFSRSSNLSPKFILVLRRQEDFLESFFAQAAPELAERLGAKTLSDYLNMMFDTYRNDEPKSALKYFSLVNGLESLVGQDHLLVLPYEMINSDFEAFKARLRFFLELDNFGEFDRLKTCRTNVRSSSRGKLVNQIQLSTSIKKAIFGNVSFGGLGKKLQFFDSMRPKYVSLSDCQAKFVREQFTDQNKNLVKKFPYFQNLGYD